MAVRRRLPMRLLAACACAAAASACGGDDASDTADTNAPDYERMCQNIVTAFMEGELDVPTGNDDMQNRIWLFCGDFIDDYFGPPTQPGDR